MFIQEVVGLLFRKLSHTYSGIGEDLVGMDSRMEKAIKLLGLGVDDARVVGIWGTGGIGYSFIENVREVSKKCGLKTLQEQLISEILMEKDLKVGSDGRAVHMIRNMDCRKKVLIVLDDVDESTKLKKLVGEHDWFGFGSRIIITTRNQHALTRYGITHIYKVEELREDEAAELFELKAFQKHQQMGGYGELGIKKVEGIVVQYPDPSGLDSKDFRFLKQLKLRPKAFAKMSNLRILKICSMHLSEDLKYLSN
ncbi:TMV resistance protein N-like [Camellia sinensis]|uniref:TMV resistance protein N-like n=1 Tax=Camellia sinensis TaxID=4442 RepID=UPI0010360310|nr:TMV resistance protein N-like [Camellia sinensis]